MTDKTLTVQAREKAWIACKDGTSLELTVEEADALWRSITGSVQDELRRNTANIERLQQLAQDAETKRAASATLDEYGNAAFYGGMRDGLLRAVNVLEGRG